MRQFGSTLGMAVIGSLFLSIQEQRFSSYLLVNNQTKDIDPSQFQGLLSKTPQAMESLHRLSTQTAEMVQMNFSKAYVIAFSYANALSAAVAFIGLLLALFFLKGRIKPLS